MTELELEAIHQTLHRLETRWHLPIPDASIWHAYDPLPLALFLDGIRAAIRYAPGNRFLDLGCGIGTKLAFMHGIGYQVTGIDRVSHYIEAARELIQEATLIEADIFDLASFDADIIFMYRPARDDQLEDALERHVVAGMNLGAVLFLPVRPLPAGLDPVAAEVGVKV